MTTATAIPRFNDEEPSADAMDRLWAALDATLDPDPVVPPPSGTVGSCECLRCGYKWDPKPRRRNGEVTVPRPRLCANPECRTAYWDRPPVAESARRPAATNWEKVRQRQGEEVVRRRKQRHLAKVKALARELGLDITDPRTGKVLAATHPRARVRTEELPTEPTSEQRTALAGYTAKAETWSVRPRTVPPPPGMDDLDTTSDTKG
jgi:hypothetical protein